MGKFTAYDDPWIDIQIQSQLDIIIQTIKETIKEENIKSIILSGSFGRGEGSVIIEKGSVKPLKDYDIQVIINGKVDNGASLDIREKAHQRLRMSNPERSSFRFSTFLIDVGFTTENRLALRPDIANYELKKASLVLYGDDIRGKIPWEKEDIPFRSPLRFLFEKTTGLIGHFSEEYLVEGKIVDKQKENSLVYECYKTYVEICTALCFLMNCYEPFFEQRAKLFSKNFQDKLPELHKKIPDLSEKIAKCTEFKMKPYFQELYEDPIDLWFNTRDDLLMVLKYFLEIYLDIKIDNWINSFGKICSKMDSKYHRWLAEVLLNKVGIQNRYTITSANLFLQLFLNLRYTIRLLKKHKVFHGKHLLRTSLPITETFLTSPLVLLSLERSGKNNKEYFDAATNHLKEISALENETKLSWDDVRGFYLESYYLYGDLK